VAEAAEAAQRVQYSPVSGGCFSQANAHQLLAASCGERVPALASARQCTPSTVEARRGGGKHRRACGAAGERRRAAAQPPDAAAARRRRVRDTGSPRRSRKGSSHRGEKARPTSTAPNVQRRTTLR